MALHKNYSVVCPHCEDRNYVEISLCLDIGFNDDADSCQCGNCNNYFEIEYSVEIIINTNIP
ncbi:MAG: hypothetical protein AB8G11_06265 [Saprospiraceae bacterium]